MGMKSTAQIFPIKCLSGEGVGGRGEIRNYILVRKTSELMPKANGTG